MKSILMLVALCSLCVSPVVPISRWFSYTYHDLTVAVQRYERCLTGLPPLREANGTETDYLIGRIKTVLDQTNYDNEQLANMTNFLDTICRPDSLAKHYPLSVHVNIDQFSNNVTGKINRCRAVDEAMNSIFYVLRRSALNKSEPLDFASVRFYPNSGNKEAFYNLTDLINTSWLRSTAVEHVCNLISPVKLHIKTLAANISAQARADAPSRQQALGYMGSMLDIIDRIVDRMLGLQRRVYLDSTNRLEQGYMRLSNGLSSVRDGLGSGVKAVRTRVVNIFSGSNNSTTDSRVMSNLTTSLTQNTTTLTTPKPRGLNVTLISVSSTTTAPRSSSVSGIGARSVSNSMLLNETLNSIANSSPPSNGSPKSQALSSALNKTRDDIVG